MKLVNRINKNLRKDCIKAKNCPSIDQVLINKAIRVIKTSVIKNSKELFIFSTTLFQLNIIDHSDLIILLKVALLYIIQYWRESERLPRA